MFVIIYSGYSLIVIFFIVSLVCCIDISYFVLYHLFVLVYLLLWVCLRAVLVCNMLLRNTFGFAGLLLLIA